MAYSDFKLNELVKQFDLALNENLDSFADIPEVQTSEHLKFSLKENVSLALDINTEKARSEMIIAPILKAPIIMLVEAKKEDIKAGLGQCVAEMLAAQLFNEREENEIKKIYGAVTSGTNWRFLKLEGKIVYIDIVEYYLRDVGKILGILLSPLPPVQN